MFQRLFGIALCFYVCTVNGSEYFDGLLDLVSARYTDIRFHSSEIADTLLSTNGETLHNYNYSIEFSPESVLTIQVPIGNSSVDFFRYDYNKDSVYFAYKMDSLQFFHEKKAFLQATYLSDSTDSIGKITLKSHWLAEQQLQQNGYVDYPKLISDMAAIRPNDGYPVVNKVIPMRSNVFDSLNLSYYMSNDFKRVQKILLDLRSNSATFDTLSKTVQDQFPEHDFIKLQTVINGNTHIFYVNYHEFVVFRYVLKNSTSEKRILFKNFRIR